MSRHLAYRPRHQQVRVYPQPSQRFHQEYLHQRWTYRVQSPVAPRRPLGYALLQLPWNWRQAREALQRRA